MECFGLIEPMFKFLFLATDSFGKIEPVFIFLFLGTGKIASNFKDLSYSLISKMNKLGIWSKLWRLEGGAGGDRYNSVRSVACQTKYRHKSLIEYENRKLHPTLVITFFQGTEQFYT